MGPKKRAVGWFSDDDGVTPTPTAVISKLWEHSAKGAQAEKKQQMIETHLLGVDGLWGVEEATEFFNAMNLVAGHQNYMECAGEVVQMLANAVYVKDGQARSPPPRPAPPILNFIAPSPLLSNCPICSLD